MPTKFRLVGLSKPCKDIVTGLNGMVTHHIILMDNTVSYIFQPKGINPEDGQPVQRIIVVQNRIIASENDYENIEVPIEILGTEISDKASGFSGTAIELVRYTHGCFHVIIQPKGKLRRTNSTIKHSEFDLRQCEGPMIKQLDATQIKESQKKNPSPDPSYRHREVGDMTSGVIDMRR